MVGVEESIQYWNIVQVWNVVVVVNCVVVYQIIDDEGFIGCQGYCGFCLLDVQVGYCYVVGFYFGGEIQFVYFWCYFENDLFVVDYCGCQVQIDFEFFEFDLDVIGIILGGYGEFVVGQKGCVLVVEVGE